MSYSRYLTSRFYTYPMENSKGEVVFCVDCEYEFTAQELREDIEKCLNIANTPTDNPLNPGYGRSLPELREELRGYMQEFLRDIDAGFFANT